MAGMRTSWPGGLIRHVGVSNYPGRWRAAETALGGPVVSNQVRYSLLTRKPERSRCRTRPPPAAWSSPTAPSPRGC